MKDLFGDVGECHAAGIWEDTPRDNVAFREKYKKQIEAQAKKRKAEEMI
jgi:3,8-divinyl chlorophyllide a/chlorophyllide a reductase subunit Y